MTASDHARRWIGSSLVAGLAVVGLVACGDTPDATVTAPVSTAPPDPEGAGADDVDDVDTDDVEVDEVDDGEPSDAGDDAPAAPGRPALPALGDVTLLTEPSDVQRPLLEWEPVPGAAVYSVSVFTPDGVGYWAWRTEATSVHLGGDPQLRDDVSGPSTAPGMTWSVLAFDGDQMPIAASVRAVLHP